MQRKRPKELLETNLTKTVTNESKGAVGNELEIKHYE